MHADRRTNVITVLTPPVRKLYVIQQRWINFVSSGVTLDGTHVVDETITTQATLKSCHVHHAEDPNIPHSYFSELSRCHDKHL